jgi:hypothetical protein
MVPSGMHSCAKIFDIRQKTGDQSEKRKEYDDLIDVGDARQVCKCPSAADANAPIPKAKPKNRPAVISTLPAISSCA